jgi:hypothetical protein
VANELVRGKRGMGLNGHSEPVQGKSNEWYSPPEIIDPIVRSLWSKGLQIDLDPSSPTGGLPWLPAIVHFDEEIDGLAQDWFGFVWLNPPFGREAGRWLQKMGQHGYGIALVACRCNTRWWHQTVAKDAVGQCQLYKRPHFYNERHERASFNSGGDIVLLSYGETAHEVLKAADLGSMSRFDR